MNAYNYITNREYTGKNAEVLKAAGVTACMTFKQAQDNGYRIRKGSHGIKCTFKNSFFWVFRIEDCLKNGKPVNINEPVEQDQPKTEPVEELKKVNLDQPEEKPVMISHEPDQLEEQKETTQEEEPEELKPVFPSWEVINEGKQIVIRLNERTSGTFNISGILNMNTNDIKRFMKEWISHEGMKQVFLEELNRNGKHYESATQKKILFGETKTKVDSDLTKAVKYLTKQDKFFIKRFEDKTIMCDSYMLIECSNNDLEQLANNVPLLLELKEQNMLNSASCIKNGKSHDFRPDAPDMIRLINGTAWNEGNEINFNYSLKNKDNIMEASGTYAAAKMINLFKDKVFRQVGAMKALTRVTDSYRALVLPVRYSS